MLRRTQAGRVFCFGEELSYGPNDEGRRVVTRGKQGQSE